MNHKLCEVLTQTRCRGVGLPEIPTDRGEFSMQMMHTTAASWLNKAFAFRNGQIASEKYN